MFYNKVWTLVLLEFFKQAPPSLEIIPHIFIKIHTSNGLIAAQFITNRLRSQVKASIKQRSIFFKYFYLKKIPSVFLFWGMRRPQEMRKCPELSCKGAGNLTGALQHLYGVVLVLLTVLSMRKTGTFRHQSPSSCRLSPVGWVLLGSENHLLLLWIHQNHFFG